MTINKIINKQKSLLSGSEIHIGTKNYKGTYPCPQETKLEKKESPGIYGNNEVHSESRGTH